jgi:putative flippase GtrA
LVIGGIASAIDVGLFVLLYEVVGISAIIAHSISIPISAIYSFFCNAVFNFRTTDKILSRFLSFSVVVALGYGLGVLIIYFVESNTALGGTFGKLLSLPAVFFFQYFLNSRISFKE